MDLIAEGHAVALFDHLGAVASSLAVRVSSRTRDSSMASSKKHLKKSPRL